VRERFGALVADLDVTEPEGARDLLEEAGFLAHRFHERHARFGERDPQGEAGKAGTAPDIDDPLATAPRTHGDRGERVEKMFHRYIGRRCDRSEVHRRIAFDEQIRVPLALGERPGVQMDSDALGVASERGEGRNGGLGSRHDG